MAKSIAFMDDFVNEILWFFVIISNIMKFVAIDQQKWNSLKQLKCRMKNCRNSLQIWKIDGMKWLKKFSFISQFKNV